MNEEQLFERFSSRLSLVFASPAFVGRFLVVFDRSRLSLYL